MTQAEIELLQFKYEHMKKGVHMISEELIRASEQGVDKEKIEKEMISMGEWGLGLIDLLEAEE